MCKAYCGLASARNLKDAWKCTFEQPTLGIALAAQTSDAGQHIITRHGSVRTKGYAPIPEDAFREQFGLLINNNVEVPRVPRNSVSCRKEHRESTSGRYRPHLDDNGKPILRTGFMVDCDTSSDCYSRCGEHPISGVSYVCTPHPRFYSFFVTNSSSSGFYFDEPGDDRFDVTNQSRGVCTDVRYDFQHSGCESMTGSGVILGLVGCTAKLGWQRAYAPHPLHTHSTHTHTHSTRPLPCFPLLSPAFPCFPRFASSRVKQNIWR